MWFNLKWEIAAHMSTLRKKKQILDWKIGRTSFDWFTVNCEPLKFDVNVNGRVTTLKSKHTYARKTDSQLYLPLIDIIICYSDFFYLLSIYRSLVRLFVCTLEYLVRHCWMVKSENYSKKKKDRKKRIWNGNQNARSDY